MRWLQLQFDVFYCSLTSNGRRMGVERSRFVDVTTALANGQQSPVHLIRRHAIGPRTSDQISKTEQLARKLPRSAGPDFEISTWGEESYCKSSLLGYYCQNLKNVSQQLTVYTANLCLNFVRGSWCVTKRFNILKSVPEDQHITEIMLPFLEFSTALL